MEIESLLSFQNKNKFELFIKEQDFQLNEIEKYCATLILDQYLDCIIAANKINSLYNTDLSIVRGNIIQMETCD